MPCPSMPHNVSDLKTVQMSPSKLQCEPSSKSSDMVRLNDSSQNGLYDTIFNASLSKPMLTNEALNYKTDLNSNNMSNGFPCNHADNRAPGSLDAPNNEHRIETRSDIYATLGNEYSTYKNPDVNHFGNIFRSNGNGSNENPYSFNTPVSSLTTSSLMPINVKSMLLHGIPDREVMKSWLSSIKCEDYLKNFLDQGYDMRILTRMTPQDLAAIGCKLPAVRKKLLLEIKKLNIDDDIPSSRPESLEKWLSLLKLIEYYPGLCREGYDTIDKVCSLTWEDLEDIGVVKLGHQKRLLLGIEKLKKFEAKQRDTREEQIYDVNPNHRMSLYADSRINTLSRSTSRSGFYQTRSGANLDRRGLPVAVVMPALKHINNQPISSDVTLQTMPRNELIRKCVSSAVEAPQANRFSTSSLNQLSNQASNTIKSNDISTLKRAPLPPVRSYSLKPQDMIQNDNPTNSIYGTSNGTTFMQPQCSTSSTNTLRTPKLGTLTATTTKMLTSGGHLMTLSGTNIDSKTIVPVREAPQPPYSSSSQHQTICERYGEDPNDVPKSFINPIDSSASPQIMHNLSIGHQLAGAEEFPPPPPAQ